MNLFAKAVSLLTFFKAPGRDFNSFANKEAYAALQHCLQWFENVLNDDGLPASSYSLLLDKLNGPSARTVAHWLDVIVLNSSAQPPDKRENVAFQQQADTLAEWLVKIQRNDGTWPVGSNDYKNRPPSVFQTGIIIDALISYSEKFGAKPDVSMAIENGVQWLFKMQKDNGGWDEYVFGKHLICTNAAAALVKAGIYMGNTNLVKQGKKSLDYYFSFQIGNGFFYFLPTGQKDYFASDYGFVLYGFSKAAFMEGSRTYAEKVWQGVKPFIYSGKGHGIIPGIINYEFNAPVNYYSLYGSVLAMLTTLRIYPLLRMEEIAHQTRSLAKQIASAQLKSENKMTHGGFAVSQPSSGGYKPYEISGDAIALFAKALLLLMNTEHNPEYNSNTGVAINRDSIL